MPSFSQRYQLHLPHTGYRVNISQPISCQATGVYAVLCKNTTGACARLAPIYIGVTGGGRENPSFTHRMGQHLGTATQACHAETRKTVGRHFRLPGHEPNRDMQMLPLERVPGYNVFLMRATEHYYIEQI